MPLFEIREPILLRPCMGRTVEMMTPETEDTPYLARVSLYLEGLNHPVQEFGEGPTPTAAVDDAQVRLDMLLEIISQGPEWAKEDQEEDRTAQDRPGAEGAPFSASDGFFEAPEPMPLCAPTAEMDAPPHPWPDSPSQAGEYPAVGIAPHLAPSAGVVEDMLPPPIVSSNHGARVRVVGVGPNGAAYTAYDSTQIPREDEPHPLEDLPLEDRVKEMRRLHAIANEHGIVHHELREMAYTSSLRHLDAQQLRDLSLAIENPEVDDQDNDTTAQIGLAIATATSDEAIEHIWNQAVLALLPWLHPFSRLDLYRARRARLELLSPSNQSSDPNTASTIDFGA